MSNKTKILKRITIILVLINIFQFVWFSFPFTAFGVASIPDEETALSYASRWIPVLGVYDYWNSYLEDSLADFVVMDYPKVISTNVEYIKGKRYWIITSELEDGTTESVTLKMRNGKVVH